MKAAYLLKPEEIEVRDIPVRREPGAGEVLVEPICVGLSGHDGLTFRKGPKVVDGYLPPIVPGSEFVGRVVSVGRSVSPSLRGQRIVANPVSPCLDCHWCREGDHNLCPNVRILGEGNVPGALQQRIAWPAALCTTLPDSIPDAEAVLLIQLANAIHIIDMANLKTMENCAVIGCGHLGLLLIKALRAAGAGTIVGVELLEFRQQAALSHGADYAVSPVKAIDLAKSLPRGGFDVAIDVSNAAEACRLSVGIARVGGRALMASSPRDNRVLFNAYEARMKQITMQFVRRSHGTFRRAVELMESGRLGSLSSLITHRFDLMEVEDAFRAVHRMSDELIKAVIDMPPYEAKEESPEALFRVAQAAESSEETS